MSAKESSIERRSAARLAAVQALYEMDMVGAQAEPVLQEFLERRWSNATPIDHEDDASDPPETEEAPKPLPAPEQRFLKKLVRGVAEHADSLDEAVSPRLNGDRASKDLDALVRSILRAGTFELLHCPDVGARTVITQYVGLSHAFFAGKEPALVNVVLDALAHEIRSEEMAKPAAGSG
ncbi:MAG: transcription antitermination factor NusB [Magnetovibrio sp.]|nr:transcription antitermination factor NusB [Magnetovibrio sp.]